MELRKENKITVFFSFQLVRSIFFFSLSICDTRFFFSFYHLLKTQLRSHFLKKKDVHEPIVLVVVASINYLFSSRFWFTTD